MISGTSEVALDPEVLKVEGDWDENRALARLRATHKLAHGALGERAQRFTEGGYCTLYAEGRKLAGRGAVDDAIARACARVYDNEVDHMLKGIAGLEGAPLDERAWALLIRLTTEQCSSRIRMRNAQLSHPVTKAREDELCAGLGDPVEFDYERAGLVRP